MVFGPDYVKTTQFISIAIPVGMLVVPPLFASVVAAEKGYNIGLWVFIFCFYSFFGIPVLATFLDIELPERGKEAVKFLFLIPVTLLPVWYAYHLKPTAKLKQASLSEGIELKCCTYCIEPFDRCSHICPNCHYRTHLSLAADWRFLTLITGAFLFLLAFFSAYDEIVGNLYAYNMLVPLKIASVLFLLSVAPVSGFSVLIILLLELLAAVCVFYVPVKILQAVGHFTRGKPVRPTLTLIMALIYSGLVNPVLVASMPWLLELTAENQSTPATLNLSLGWWLMVLAYIVIFAAFHFSRNGGDKISGWIK